MPLPRLLLLTLLTLTAFAANSVLCRLALFEERMDPALFTLLRLTSGALMLILLCRVRHQSPRQGDWGGGLALIAYGAAFSFAYLTLTAGTGALLAALAGIIWLDESWSLRLLLSSLGILGGIALVITGRPPQGDKA
ncbi:hypothetical protein [Aeromonas media]|uniref:hypothetical protein n=1 Tax=Aeromonas media TaxID=651 RepID=UPI003D19B230